MEPKVVHASLRRAKQTGQWQYDAGGTLALQSGSGNNWARGYNTYGTRVRDAALELVRRETEACDHLGGFLLMQSMAGGTGAGLGAYVAQALRDDYPASPLVNHCIWPYESGEVIVQCYNTLLTLAALLVGPVCLRGARKRGGGGGGEVLALTCASCFFFVNHRLRRPQESKGKGRKKNVRIR